MKTNTDKRTYPRSLSLRVTDEELDWLRDEAARQERTIASLLRIMLRHYLETKA